MKWIRLWVDNHMNKDTCWKDLNLAERGAFYSLLIVAGKCNLNGEIAVAPSVGYSDKQLAAMLHCTEGEYAQHLAKLTALKMVERRPDDTLFIVNWSSYQDEFARQRKYKMRKQLDKKATDSATPESYGLGYTPEDRSQKTEVKKTNKKSVDPALRARWDFLINLFANAFKQATGSPYMRTFDQDTIWAKKMIALLQDSAESEVAARLDRAVERYRTDPQYSPFPTSAIAFQGRVWNRYAGNGKPSKPVSRAMTPAEVEAGLRD